MGLGWGLFGFVVLVGWALWVVWLFRRMARQFQHERAERSEHSQALPPSVMPPPPGDASNVDDLRAPP